MENLSIKIDPNNNGEVIIRTGEAPVIHDPLQVNVIGSLNAPSVWSESKKDKIDILNSSLFVNRDEKQIKLVINEASVFHDTIIGKASLSDDFKKFKINTGQSFDNFKLAELIKMNRHLVSPPTAAHKLVSDLKNFRASVDKTIENSRDDRGNARMSVNQAVESNLPESFTLNVRLFKGDEHSTSIEVEVTVNPDTLECSLVSPGTNELIDDLLRLRFDCVIKSVKSNLPGIAVIEE